MTSSRSREEMSALQQLALEDLMAMDDSQILAEASEAGEDVEAAASALKMMLRESVAAELRSRLLGANQEIAQRRQTTASVSRLPALDEIKRRVLEAFNAEPALGLAYRDRKEKTESDWQSLYEDLIELGAIAPDQNDD